MFRVSYPLITTDAARDFATREEAEKFVIEITASLSSSPYTSRTFWPSQVRIKEIPAEGAVQ